MPRILRGVDNVTALAHNVAVKFSRGLWPYLVGHATPVDVLEFGTPPSPDALKARAAAWSDEEIAAFLRSPEARPDPTASAGHWGAATIVAQLIGALGGLYLGKLLFEAKASRADSVAVRTETRTP